MDIVFQKEYLSDLYYKGKTSDKNHRYQPQVIRKYVKVVGILESVKRMEDLFLFNSLHFEALQAKENYFSARVDLQYRLEFSMSSNEGEKTLTICNLEELTNHYKK